MNKKKDPPNNKGMPLNKKGELDASSKGKAKEINGFNAVQSGSKLRRRSLNQTYIDDQRPKG